MLTVVGDSLAQGSRVGLEAALDGWEVRTDAQRSRPLAAGMAFVPLLPVRAPAVLAFSLFTNDDPRNLDALEAAVRANAIRAGPGGCALWATIVRPKVAGRSYAAANALLQRLAADPALGSTLRLVPWAAEAVRRPRWLAGDRDPRGADRLRQPRAPVRRGRRELPRPARLRLAPDPQEPALTHPTNPSARRARRTRPRLT